MILIMPMTVKESCKIARESRVKIFSDPEMIRKRFWAMVNKNAPNGCWEWTGSRTPKNYGGFTMLKKWHSAHRVSWEWSICPIPDGLCVCHKCDNPPCCNPDHLFLGTKKENGEDMSRKGRSGKARGEGHGKTTLTNAQVKEIRDGYSGGRFKQAEIAEKYGVCKATVSNIVNKKTWIHT